MDLAKWKENGKTKIAVVFNLDTHDQPGSHWTSLFIDLEEKIIFYFDSAANPTPKEVNALVNELRKQGKPLGIRFRYMENYPYSHQNSNTECGMYSLFFIITMLTKEIEGKHINDKTIYHLFLGKKSLDSLKGGLTNYYGKFKNRIPDKYVQDYRSKYFNV